MFDTTYSGVSGWMLFTPWFFMVLWLILLARHSRRYKALKKELSGYKDVPGQWTREQLGAMVASLKKQRDEAESESRELSAALAESGRKLDAEKLYAEDAAARILRLSLKVGELTQPRAKDGKFKRKAAQKKK